MTVLNRGDLGSGDLELGTNEERSPLEGLLLLFFFNKQDGPHCKLPTRKNTQLERSRRQQSHGDEVRRLCPRRGFGIAGGDEASEGRFRSLPVSSIRVTLLQCNRTKDKNARTGHRESLSSHSSASQHSIVSRYLFPCGKHAMGKEATKRKHNPSNFTPRASRSSSPE